MSSLDQVPFTVSHIAAVLPLRRSGLPFAALAAGSIAPDLPYFLPLLSRLGAHSGVTHSRVGVLTADVALGLAAWMVWRAMALPLHDLAPHAVRTRWQPWARPAAHAPQVLLAVAVGAATHVGWDEFTHQGRFGARHIAALAELHPALPGDLPGYQYAQFVSSIVGLALLAWIASRRSVVACPPRLAPTLATALPWLLGAGAAIGALIRSADLTGSPSVRTVAFYMITSTMSGAAAAGGLTCAVWWARTRTRRRPQKEPTTVPTPKVTAMPTAPTSTLRSTARNGGA